MTRPRLRLNGNSGNGHDTDHDAEQPFRPRSRLPVNYGNTNWAGDGSIRATRGNYDTPDNQPSDPYGRGRKTLYRPEYIEQARKLAELGHTDCEIARFFGVGTQTFKTWISRYPELLSALKVGKDVADDRVERSLYQKAVGFEVETEKIFCQDGEIIRAKTKTYYPPDTAAAFIWLKNRRGWTDRARVEFTPGPESFADELRERLDKLEVPKEIQLKPAEFKRVN